RNCAFRFPAGKKEFQRRSWSVKEDVLAKHPDTLPILESLLHPHLQKGAFARALQSPGESLLGVLRPLCFLHFLSSFQNFFNPALHIESLFRDFVMLP